MLFVFTFCFGEIIKEIKVNGNKRLSKESIIVFGKIEINSNYNSNDLNIILKNLYETNFFKEVNLQTENNLLIIDVLENPIIEDLEVNGIRSTSLRDVLTDAMNLKSRKSYVESVFLKDVNLITNIIKSNGYYFSKIKTSSIKNEEQNSIRLIYDIDLGKKAKINEIVFLGDKKIKDRKLKNVITSEVARFWKFISKNTFLNKDRINLDIRLLTNYYKDSGYYNAKIENSFVEYKDNGSFKLIFNINSGKKFTFNNLNLNVPDDYDQRYFEKITNLLFELKDKTYSLNKINKVLKEIDKVALSKQYEFITANLEENIIGDNKLDIVISLTESKKFYVEKINILGNQYTREDVIRNVFVVDEGDPLNEILFNKSINNIKAKNIFGSVKSKVKNGSKENLKIIDIIVEEKPTGEISLAAGVGTSGTQIGGGIKENNFLGKGIQLDTNLLVSKNSVQGKFMYTKPNFNYTDNTLFTSVRSTSTDNIADFGYKSKDLGLSFGTSFEQYENLYFRPELDLSVEDLQTTSTASNNLKKQKGDYFDLYLNYSLNYDLRNQRYKPSEGYQNVFYQELPIVSNNYELVNSIESTLYKPLASEMIARISFYGKMVNTLSSEDVRISKRLYIPQNKLRGFESGMVGPKDNKDFIGGNYVSAVNLAVTLPKALPSFQNTDVSVFLDAANIWGVDYSSNISSSQKIRSAAGIAVDLTTPIGPLNFSFSQPITKSSTDRTETFRFNLGTTF